MTAASHVLKHELNDLVLEQICEFKQPTDITERLLEYHLRYQRIMTLYRELDQVRLERHPVQRGFR